MKKALLVRLGAYGDMIIITPVLRELKRQGYYVILNTSERGLDLLKDNPNIDEFIPYVTDSVPLSELDKHWEKQKEEIKPEFYCNFSRSIEQNVALHPTDPMYIYPKDERFEHCNKNYYEVTAEWAGLEIEDLRPDLYISDEVGKEAKSYIKPDKFNILWGMSGSGRNKVYPWVEYVIGEVLNNYTNIHFITVGDEKCQIIESRDENITNISGKTGMLTSCALTEQVQLVISPDTGVLHASGSFTTPKIGLLGHTTKENITKHFLNDYSLEAECECAPCHRLVYAIDVQCPIEFVTGAVWCQAVGLPPERVYEQITKVIPPEYKKEDNGR